VAYFKAQSQHLSRKTEESHEKLQLELSVGFQAEIWDRDLPNTKQVYQPPERDVRSFLCFMCAQILPYGIPTSEKSYWLLWIKYKSFMKHYFPEKLTVA
jgi:hypothetical protein